MKPITAAIHHCCLRQATVRAAAPTPNQLLPLPSDTSVRQTADAGHLACVKYLLEEGADIEQRNVVRILMLVTIGHVGHCWSASLQLISELPGSR